MKLIFDTETTGLVAWHLPAGDPAQPRLVQMAGLLVDEQWGEQSSFSVLVKPEGFEIPFAASKVHGITTEKAARLGVPLRTALSLFNNLARVADEVWAFNEQYDSTVIKGEFCRVKQPCVLEEKPARCAMLGCKDILKLPGKTGRDYKWPKLSEAHQFFFQAGFDKAHDALADVRATVKVMRATLDWRTQHAAEVGP